MQLISFLKNDTLFLKTQTLWFIYPILAFSDILTRKIILSFSDGSPVKKDIIKSYFSNSPHFRESSAIVKMQREPALCYANVPTSCKTKGCLHWSDPLLRVSYFLFVCLFVLFFVLFGFFFRLGVARPIFMILKFMGCVRSPWMRELKIRLDIISGSCYKRRKYPM